MKRNLSAEARQMLEERIIPFWLSLRDDENGGFIGRVDYNLKRKAEADKGTILHSRILWFFSNAALAADDEKLRKAADHAWAFISEHMIDRRYGGVYWSVTAKGEKKDRSKRAYCQAFALYAFSSYYTLTGSEEAINEALSIYNLLETKSWDGKGYRENFTEDWAFNPDNSRFCGEGVNAYYTMNTLLHIFEAYSEFYRATGRRDVAASMKRILGIYINTIYSPQKHRQEVFFSEDYTSLDDITSYGHDIESSWLIEEGARLLDDKTLIEKISSISTDMAKNVFSEAYDSEGFIINENRKGIKDRKRIWWVEAEAIEGFLNEYRKSKEEKYKEAAVSIWDYINKYFVDKRSSSEWFSELDDSNIPDMDLPIADPWKCPYHNGRLCLHLLKAD